MNAHDFRIAKRLYGEGVSAAAIGELLVPKRSAHIIRYYLKKNGVVLRVPGHRRGLKHEPNEDTEKIIALRKQGKTFVEIARLFGLTPKAAQARLKYHGLN